MTTQVDGEQHMRDWHQRCATGTKDARPVGGTMPAEVRTLRSGVVHSTYGGTHQRALHSFETTNGNAQVL